MSTINDLAKVLAPEDIRPGRYVAVFQEHVEFLCGAFCNLPGKTLVVERVTFTPSDQPLILKVDAVCLPYVFVRTPNRETRLIDIRTVSLAAVSTAFARRVLKRVKAKGDKCEGKQKI